MSATHPKSPRERANVAITALNEPLSFRATSDSEDGRVDQGRHDKPSWTRRTHFLVASIHQDNSEVLV